jgi:hypothetical protein
MKGRFVLVALSIAACLRAHDGRGEEDASQAEDAARRDRVV